MIKHKEEIKLNIEQIIIGYLFNLYNKNRPLELSDDDLKETIEEIKGCIDFFADKITLEVTTSDKNKFIMSNNYLNYKDGVFELKDSISSKYIETEAHKIDNEILMIIVDCANIVEERKYKELITYKEQVLVSLYVLKRMYGLNKITSVELRKYRVKIAEYYSSYSKRVTLESSKEAIDNFRNAYRNEIESILSNDEITYILKDNLRFIELESLALNSVSSDAIMQVLSSPQIIEESFEPSKKLKLI